MSWKNTNLGLLGFVVALSAGCITESDTGLQPQPAAERLQAQLELARGYLGKGDLAGAKRPVDRALEIDPRAVEAHVLKAIILHQEGETELAEAQYKLGLKIDPYNSQALNNYGAFLFGLGRSEEALAPLRRVVLDTGYTQRAQAYENLGLTELRVGNIDAAEAALQRALMLSGTQWRANLELAHIYFDRSEIDLAQQYYDAFVREARQSARSLWLGIRLSRATNDQDLVASYALALRNLFPRSGEYRAYRDSLQ